MSEEKYFAKLFSDLEGTALYWEEKSILDFTIDLYNLMKKRGVNRKELAGRLGTSPAYITRVLKGDANFTIKSMVKLVRALDGSLTIHVIPKEENRGTWFHVAGRSQSCPLNWKFREVEKSDQYMTGSGEDHVVQYAA